MAPLVFSFYSYDYTNLTPLILSLTPNNSCYRPLNECYSIKKRIK